MSYCRIRALLFISIVVALSACGDDDDGPPAPDGGTPCVLQGVDWSHATAGVTVGTTRDVSIELRRDFSCNDVSLSFEIAGTGSIEALPADLVFEPLGTSRFPLEITGTTEGVLTVTAIATSEDGQRVEADLEVAITGTTLPQCEGEASGNVAPGGAIEAASGTLRGAAIGLTEGASRDDEFHVDAFDVAIGCASAPILPEGYRALGPAVSLASTAGKTRFPRELDLAVPIRLALLPTHAHRGHVEVAYVGPGVSAPRIVPIADPVFEGSAGDGVFRFRAPRLGTYQAVVREDAPQRRDRRFVYRGITGVSMGGSGSGRVGLGNPDRFDFVAPLGGPTDWQYMLEYIRRYHLGGFCTEEERQSGTVDCSAASQDRAPARGQFMEHVQHFENWWYEDAYDGQGGRFDRREYLEIFRDLSAMFGNANTDAGIDEDDPNVAPPGTPDAERYRLPAERCANVIRIEPEPVGGDEVAATGWFDDEYNPEGRYPVISFCDGAEMPGDTGRWNPEGDNNAPAEVAYAVDVNGNGRRDPGEPVIRNGREPYRDVGSDGAPSPLEEGYDAITNPDPAGDDYDFQYNPLGTEGNWDREEGEPFDDFGLDGVDGTAQLADGGYDSGEGDGVFTRSRGAQRMIDASPRGMLREMDDATARAQDVFADGGVRDLFNWVVMGHHSMGAFASRGIPVRFFNGHNALYLDGREDDFDFARVPWSEIGRHSMVRYGSIDATEAEKVNGDGGHVGTVLQIQHRLFASLAAMDRRWPGGDRVVVRDSLCQTIGTGCEHVNSIELDFDAPTAQRRGPVTIILPPGYFDAQYADYRYPVVYFLHGYGMEPGDLLATGLLLWNFMTDPRLPEAHRFQKAIFVFPDGRCRGAECVNGTFYTDAPESTPNGPAMETFLLDVVDYVDATYRTRAPETIEVWE
ncbi:hypothetical protein [Sandaracinus amylolyticus]|uniref:hypothetical protein n=1 Tax=Sandaracinus amylolyticus TaxID=927083 RepID=UPI001F1D53EF|nr:hypothetical protein [Sandaracinus amylolyticus]UJR85879.1 Hypothetical protein I5071_79590 [Sandaracinus amylolyticus]